MNANALTYDDECKLMEVAIHIVPISVHRRKEVEEGEREEDAGHGVDVVLS